MLRKRSIATKENNFAVDSSGRRRGAPGALPRSACAAFARQLWALQQRCFFFDTLSLLLVEDYTPPAASLGGREVRRSDLPADEVLGVARHARQSYVGGGGPRRGRRREGPAASAGGDWPFYQQCMRFIKAEAKASARCLISRFELINRQLLIKRPLDKTAVGSTAAGQP